MATATKQKTEREDLGALDLGSAKIFVAPLPSPTKSFIVRYDFTICISCVIPAKQYKILVRPNGSRRANRNQSATQAYKDLSEKTVKAPSLILMHEYHDAPTYKNVRDVVGDCSLYAYHTRHKDKSVILGAPYLISNVHSGGHICFGDMSPVTPREAFATFWNSPFNAELLGEHLEREEDSDYDYDSVSDYIDEYHDTVYREQPWEDITSTVCGKKSWACPKGADAVLITSDRLLLTHIPRKYWRKFNGSPIVIARGKMGKKTWAFESGGFKFKLPIENVTFSNYGKDNYRDRMQEWRQLMLTRLNRAY